MRRDLTGDVAGRPGEVPPQSPLPALERGSGTPVVLFHGYAMPPRTYRRTVESLADRARVIVPEWTATDGSWSYEAALAALEVTLDDRGIDRAVFVGHSFGGALALGFAARHPDKVAPLVLADSMGLLGHWDLAWEALSGTPRLYRLATYRSATGFFRAWGARPRALARAAWWGFTCDLTGEIRRVAHSRVRTHVLWAERDTILSRERGEEIARTLRATFTVVTDPAGRGPVDHDWLFRHPHLFPRLAGDLGILDEPDAREASA